MILDILIIWGAGCLGFVLGWTLRYRIPHDPAEGPWNES